MKRILGFISVVGVLGGTVLLIFSLATNFGKVFPKVELPKLEYPKVEHTKLEYSEVEHTKLESGDPSPPNQPPAPLPPESEPESSDSAGCDPFGGMDLSVILLSIREDIMVFPLYLKTEGDVIPWLVPHDEDQTGKYRAYLGNDQSNSCELQGFDDRLYCMFDVSPDMPGSIVALSIYWDDCLDPAFIQSRLVIPELQPAEGEKTQCNRDLGQKKCEAAGGKMSTSLTTAPYCICP